MGGKRRHEGESFYFLSLDPTFRLSERGFLNEEWRWTAEGRVKEKRGGREVVDYVLCLSHAHTHKI